MAEVKEFGEVIEIQGRIVKVKMQPQDTCTTCGHKAICFAVGKERILIARAESGVREGDMVCLDFPSGPSIISSLLIFVGSVFVPLAVLLIAGLAQASVLFKAISAVAVLLGYWIFLIILNKRLKRSGWFLPRAYKSTEEPNIKETAK